MPHKSAAVDRVGEEGKGGGEEGKEEERRGRERKGRQETVSLRGKRGNVGYIEGERKGKGRVETIWIRREIEQPIIKTGSRIEKTVRTRKITVRIGDKQHGKLGKGIKGEE